MPIPPLRIHSRTVRHADGSEVRLHELRARALRPLPLRAPARLRAREAAAILTHITGAPQATLSLPAAGIRAPQGVLGFDTDDHGEYPTVRGAILAYLARRRAGGAPEAPIERFIVRLARRGLVARHGDGAPTPVGGLGFLRTLSQLIPTRPLVNTHFFLFDPRELDAPQAALGDITGMLALSGRIHHPPLLPRATLFRSHGRWRIEPLAADDLELRLAGGEWWSPRTPGLHWHYRGDGIPDPPDYPLQLVIQGRSIHAWHPPHRRLGGEARVPHGGLLLGFEHLPNAALRRAWRAHPQVEYRLPRYPDLDIGIGAGPALVRAGELIIDDQALAAERFWTLGYPDATAPLIFPNDAAATRAARAGIGITAGGGLVLVTVEGRSRLAATGAEPTGATLVELAEQLIAAGAREAMNFDGGGSTQIFLAGGALHPSSDRRGTPGFVFERPLPVGLALL